MRLCAHSQDYALPSAYEHFDARDDGWTKVVLKPQLASM
jgi:hypothetical protein